MICGSSHGCSFSFVGCMYTSSATACVVLTLFLRTQRHPARRCVQRTVPIVRPMVPVCQYKQQLRLGRLLPSFRALHPDISSGEVVQVVGREFNIKICIPIRKYLYEVRTSRGSLMKCHILHSRCSQCLGE